MFHCGAKWCYDDWPCILHQSNRDNLRLEVVKRRDMLLFAAAWATATIPAHAEVGFNFISRFSGKAAVAGYTGKRIVDYQTTEKAGSIIIDTSQRKLYLVLMGGKAIQYGVGVGREGFAWSGTAHVGRKVEWPDWHPPEEMITRELRQNGRQLPEKVVGGIYNPLGARALYLYQGNRDTLYRIHGTNEPGTIGQAVSSGCIRMLNEEVIDLYNRVKIGTKVIVLK